MEYNVMSSKVTRILSEYSGINVSDITERSELINDLGLNSFDVVNIVVAFEDEFDIEIPDCIIADLRSVGDILKYLSDKIGN